MCCVALKNICLAIFLQIVIKESVAEFVFIKTPYFQHILLNTFKRMHLKYVNYSLRRTLFQTFRQHSLCKSLIAKTFDGITIKVKAASPIQVTKNKNYCFQLFLNQICTLTFIFCAPFFARPIAQFYLRTRKIGRLEENLSSHILHFIL